VLLVLLPLAIGLGVGLYRYNDHVAQQALDAAIAELDATDPRWRLADIEADRKQLPDKDNAALVIKEVIAQLPKPWPSRPPADAAFSQQAPPSLDERVGEVAPQQQLEPAVTYDLRTELAKAQPALLRARALANLSRGRFPVTYAADGISTLLPGLQDSREAASLLCFDALLRAQDKDLDGALDSDRAIVVVGRTVGDEPLFVSQLVRMVIRGVAVSSLERTLAQGQASEKALSRVQRLLEDEEAVPVLEILLRGERALLNVTMKEIESGKVAPGQLMTGLDADSGSGGNKVGDLWLNFAGGIMAKRAHPVLLRTLTEYIEASRLPPQEQVERFAQIESTAQPPRAHVFVKLLPPAMSKVAASSVRSQAGLRCAIAALAVERFRLTKERWPKSLDEVVAAKLLAALPTDPYDGQPLRYKMLDDRILIYSVGPDLEDNGGNLDRQKPIEKGIDLGFQLWNPEQRRKPPVNPEVGPPQPTKEDLEFQEQLRWLPQPADNGPPTAAPQQLHHPSAPR
jgi:hypothetical protein